MSVIGNTMPVAREERTPGTCRVCGCTDGNACVVRGVAALSSGTFRGALLLREDLEPADEVATCSWTEADLCSRCHGPRQPTRRQACEFERLRAFKGEIAVRAGGVGGELEVDLVGEAAGRAPVTLTLDRDGRVVDRWVPPEPKLEVDW